MPSTKKLKKLRDQTRRAADRAELAASRAERAASTAADLKAGQVVVDGPPEAKVTTEPRASAR
ncbi:MAG: hypothetical protein ACRDQ1_07260 [Sciscionella sp.]